MHKLVQQWLISLEQVYPGVRSAGKYILIEIDRSMSVGNSDDDDVDGEVKELVLYSLQVCRF